MTEPRRDAARTARRVVAEARAWIGTPYHHQASLRGVGCDCLGLLRGVWRFLYGTEPETPPPYTATWAEDRGEETLREAARRHLTEIALAESGPGDVWLFRWRPTLPAKHCGILSGPGRMIHAYDGHAVTESWIPDAWRRRAAYAFRFPEDPAGAPGRDAGSAPWPR
ncbi:NlpC/P60 family putative phage cell wall peptidase [Methylobacterium aerolatum]|uniref:NlpC/P60 family putative phage cell wall peptidase n=1 Tax=Methylobacterium aerolatum TaxID=418708 RepID=A0ABU0I4N5_9HYPH|nr:NlpC/P60 family protein [Methylobacterium aerolatum]MDQ0448840.1 NlpC/P60 family putative phage cell wall peptidase [Methylobacterium aerolatum]